MVKSSQNWWNVRFFHLFRHQFCFKEDKMLILLRWSFIVAEACSVAFDVSVCLRYLENQMLFVVKDIWTSNTNCSTTERRRFSEPARGIWPTGNSTEWASRDSPRPSVFRYCGPLKDAVETASLCISHQTGTGLNAPKGHSGRFQHTQINSICEGKSSPKLKPFQAKLFFFFFMHW